MQDIRPVSRVISCAITVHQCCNHWGQLSTAILNTVSPPFPGELLEMSLCPILLCPSLVLSCFLAPLSLSLPQHSFFSVFADSASISLNPLCSAESFASSMSLLFTLIWRCLLLSLLPRPVRADISGAIRQVVRCDFTRLCETRDEKRSVKGGHVNVLDTSRDVSKCAINST